MKKEKNTRKLKYFGRDLEAMSFAKNYHNWIIDEFKKYLRGKTAEVGAGIGSFSELLLPYVDELTAYEPSENMFPALEEKYAESNKVTTIKDYFGNTVSENEETYDAIVYVNVMEHIEDDSQEYEYANRSLKRGGYLLVFVPATPFLYSKLDSSLGHFRRYTQHALIGKAKSAGFEIVRCHYFDFFGMLPWLVAFKWMKKEISGGKVSAYDSLIVPVARKIESIIKPTIGKNLLLIARKPN
jgi:SAM-dependent methyltransferase